MSMEEARIQQQGTATACAAGAFHYFLSFSFFFFFFVCVCMYVCLSVCMCVCMCVIIQIPVLQLRPPLLPSSKRRINPLLPPLSPWNLCDTIQCPYLPMCLPSYVYSYVYACFVWCRSVSMLERTRNCSLVHVSVKFSFLEYK